MTIEDETFSNAAGLAGLSERLFDTPSAIARVWRSTDYSQSMTVSVEETTSPNKRPLDFNWVVLRGDPERVKIKTLDGKGLRAEIEVDWHQTFATDRKKA